MKHFLVAFIGLYALSSMGTEGNDLPVQIVKILCESEAEPSLCEPLERLKEAEAQWKQALKDGEEERNDLNRNLEQIYILEVNIYVDDVCMNYELQKRLGQSSTIPAYMKPLCDSWLVLRATESELTEIQKTQDQQTPRPGVDGVYELLNGLTWPDLSVAPQTTKGTVDEVKLQFQKAVIDYREIRQIAMEVSCDRGFELTSDIFPTFCELWDEIQEHKQRYYQSAEVELEDAKDAVRYEITTICQSDEKFRQGKYYMEVLCRKNYNAKYI